MKARTVWCENFIRYIGSNLTKVLLFAVILSTGLMMSLVTRAKYISYVNDYHHAVAGEFYFTSNYLEEEALNKSYNISNWDRDAYSVTLRIQNFENSLLYNDADTGCYYCVDAKMYTDSNYTVEDTNFKADITYQTNAATITYNGKTYVYLPGQGETFDKEGGTQLVTVAMKADNNNKVEEVRYLKITAKTLSVAQMQEAKAQNPDMLLPTGPIFDTQLSARFKLNIHTGANIVTALTIPSQSSSELIYDVRCISTEGGAASQVRVYYDNAKVKFEDSLKYQVHQRSEDAGDTYRYIEFEVYSTSITKLVFFKRRMSDRDISADNTENKENSTIYYEIVTYTQN